MCLTVEALGATLRPLGESAHIVLIGSGPGWARFQGRVGEAKLRLKGNRLLSKAVNLTSSLFRGSSSRRQSASEGGLAVQYRLQALKTSRLKAVAALLHDNGFAHVSVLQGGFLSAAKFLVDAERGLLSSVGPSASLKPSGAGAGAESQTAASAGLGLGLGLGGSLVDCDVGVVGEMLGKIVSK